MTSRFFITDLIDGHNSLMIIDQPKPISDNYYFVTPAGQVDKPTNEFALLALVA